VTIPRHHAEWLSLLEISGPFLSMPVLMAAFPQGLDADDPAHAGELRAAYEEWAETVGSDDLSRPARQGTTQVVTTGQAIHTAWIRYVLRQTLEFPDELLAERHGIPEHFKAALPEHGETLRPDLMLISPDTRLPRLLIQVYPPAQALDKTLADRPWKANPATRLMELLRQTGVRLGLATNGEAWMLVSAKPGETTSFVTWYAGLWGEERLTLRAFRSLLGVRRFFGVPDDQTLAALLDASAVDQQEVTDQLGYQVRRAVEILVASLDQADQDRGRELLAGLSESVLYEASLTVMMRLVFLLSAEERGLLLLGDPLYDQHYAASTLAAQLHELADQHGEEVLERRYDAWSRLLAAFRAVYAGIEHENLRLPAYGGSLFDPDRFPFLEGRAPATRWRQTPAHPLPIDNRTVLHLLDALQVLQVKVPGGGPHSGLAEARRLSFRALDIEQIGHVYEGLLDHTAVRAAEPVAGLAGRRDQEPEIPLARLEAEGAKGAPAFIAYLREQTGRSESALRKALAGEGPKAKDENGSRMALHASRLRSACGNDDALYRRLLPFAGLIRDDDFGRPWVIPAGSVYVTAGADRRSSGTHYTPRLLTEPIVEHTLAPLVYTGPAEGWPKEKWRLRTPADLLELKVCDKAMGSGAFLVQACRYLSERLVEAWEEVISEGVRSDKVSLQARSPTHHAITHHSPLITPEGNPTDDLSQSIPAGADDRLILARRLVAERCLYGVDKNPLAVEMAKLSLWLATLAKGRPFDFLDHALKCGDSLVGADETMFLRWSHSLRSSSMPLFEAENRRLMDEARDRRHALRSFVVNDVRDAELKAQLLAEAETLTARVRLGCDLLVGMQFLDGMSKEEREAALANTLLEYTRGDPFTGPAAQAALAAARKHHAFHWFLEFPEVFEDGGALAGSRSGFHAFVGNPPFIGGRRIRETLGDDYREALYQLYPGSSGNADYCAFFFLRAFTHLRHGGTLGLIATNTIAQGDTRQTGLDRIIAEGGTIYNATNNQSWPGKAAVTVDIVHVAKRPMQAPLVLDNRRVHHISSFLDSGEMSGEPHLLLSNEDKSYQGSVVVGLGYVLTPEEAQNLLAINVRNRDVIFPYLNGEDLNTSPDQSPNRWVINFFDWPLEKAQTYPAPMEIIREKVYPARANVNREAHRKYWWHYGDKRPALYRAIGTLQRVLVVARVTKHLAFVFVPNGWVYNEKTFVFTFEESRYFTYLQSGLHEAWAWRYSSTMRNAGINYAPSDCFENYPFPDFELPANKLLDSIGETYHEHRRQIMLARQEGLTATYNRFHNPDERGADIARLRELHVEMDGAVAAAYGWSDMALDHGFHQTAQGLRFTISEVARREVLARLLELNHQRYAEEAAAGLHEKKGSAKVRSETKTRSKKATKDNESALRLF